MVSSSHFAKWVTLVTIQLAVLPFVDCMTRCHPGPSDENEVAVIHGHTLSDVVDGPTRGRYVVDFDVHLKKDLVIWDELQQDGIEIVSCIMKPKSRRIVIEIMGDKLDPTDFAPGVVFSIEESDLALGCMQPVPPLVIREIGDEDPYLFYHIAKMEIVDEKSVALIMDRIPGSEVVPVVDISVHEEEASQSQVNAMKNFIIDGESVESTSARTADPFTGSDKYLMSTSRTVSSFTKEVKLAKGVKLDVDAKLNVKFQNFRLVRVGKLRFEWDQKLKGSLRATLEVDREIFEKDGSGKLRRFFLPGLSLRAGIPLVGSLKAGAFLGINWVADISVSAKTRLNFYARYRRREHVTATLSSLSYTAENLQRVQKDGDHETEISTGGKFNLRLNGFFGLRPSIGVGIVYSKKKVLFQGFKIRVVTEEKGIDGNVGGSVGLQVKAKVKTPAFKPYKGIDGRIGVCDKCHSVRGSVFFTGKDLTVQTIINGEVVTEEEVEKSLFKIRLGTVCVVEQMCPVKRQLGVAPLVTSTRPILM